MTTSNPAPGNGPGLPISAESVRVRNDSARMTLHDQIMNTALAARKAHEMALALDVVHDALPISYTEDADRTTRHAFFGMPVLIDQLIRMTSEVADMVERLENPTKIEAVQ